MFGKYQISYSVNYPKAQYRRSKLSELKCRQLKWKIIEVLILKIGILKISIKIFGVGGIYKMVILFSWWSCINTFTFLNQAVLQWICEEQSDNLCSVKDKTNKNKKQKDKKKHIQKSIMCFFWNSCILIAAYSHTLYTDHFGVETQPQEYL